MVTKEPSEERIVKPKTDFTAHLISQKYWETGIKIKIVYKEKKGDTSEDKVRIGFEYESERLARGLTSWPMSVPYACNLK